jgi:hypothetical protein
MCTTRLGKTGHKLRTANIVPVMHKELDISACCHSIVSVCDGRWMWLYIGVVSGTDHMKQGPRKCLYSGSPRMNDPHPTTHSHSLQGKPSCFPDPSRKPRFTPVGSIKDSWPRLQTHTSLCIVNLYLCEQGG